MGDLQSHSDPDAVSSAVIKDFFSYSLYCTIFVVPRLHTRASACMDKAVMGLGCVMAPIIFRFRVLFVTVQKYLATQTLSVKILLMSVSHNF